MDTVVTEELQKEGMARDIVRTIQDLRKEANYSVSDRIMVGIVGDGLAISAIESNRDYIARETLADAILLEHLNPSDAKASIDFETGVIEVEIRKN